MDVFKAADRTTKEMSLVDQEGSPVVRFLPVHMIDRYAWVEPPEVEFSNKKVRPQRGRATLRLVKG